MHLQEGTAVGPSYSLKADYRVEPTERKTVSLFGQIIGSELGFAREWAVPAKCLTDLKNTSALGAIRAQGAPIGLRGALGFYDSGS